MHYVHVGAHRGQKRTSGPLELKVGEVISPLHPQQFFEAISELINGRELSMYNIITLC